MLRAKEIPTTFRCIKLELAREPGHPVGDATYGYTLFVPLDEDSKIDTKTWRSHRALCRVVRFRPDGEEEVGHLARAGDGAWTFHYDIRGEDDDEQGYRLGEEHFVPGEYVSVKSEDGMHTYRVVSVETL